MKTYDEKTLAEIQNPDLSAGYTYPGQRYVGTERVVLGGTADLYPPGGLEYDKPVYEDCLFFHPWEPGEKPGTGPAPSGDVATWDELAAAYNEGGEDGMSMDSKTLVLDVLRSLGQREAAELREGAADMDGTAIIAMERAVPAWSHEQDYSDWPKGAPVADGGQVWTLIQPHRAADYEGRPSTLRALWGLAHTKDPARAKPWVDAYGTSGMYMSGECYRADDGAVYRCKQDNCVYDAQALPSAWEKVEV